MRLLLPILLIMTFLTAFGPAAAEDSRPMDGGMASISVIVPVDVYNGYKAFMYGRSPLNIKSYDGPLARRDIIELILFQQALAAGGLEVRVELKAAPTYLRVIRELTTGNADAAGNTLWDTDFTQNADTLLATVPVIKDGQYEAGFYISRDNTRAAASKDLPAIRNLDAACNRNWVPDWQTLVDLQVKQIHHIQSWQTMVRMVANRRADFMLAPFQRTKGMTLFVGDEKLVPIHGIKVGLKGSRHFAVSRQSVYGQTVFDALQRGLAVLRKNGTIERAYTECGFFNTQAKSWRRLN